MVVSTNIVLGSQMSRERGAVRGESRSSSEGLVLPAEFPLGNIISEDVFIEVSCIYIHSECNYVYWGRRCASSDAPSSRPLLGYARFRPYLTRHVGF